MTKQAETPRTDAELAKRNITYEDDVVLANFARSLELRLRELEQALTYHENHADFLRNRLRQLEQAVEDAPHGRYCERLPDIIDDKHPLDDSKCNCWKSRIKRGEG